MLILCIGPDTFRAQRRAQELEAAFRQKYDTAGTSVERIFPGKGAVDEILERIGTVSLFSSRRFLRTHSLLEDCAKAKITSLARALLRDPENIIVVSVETEEPSRAVLEQFTEVKLIQRAYPALTGKPFFELVATLAAELEIKSDARIRSLADACAPDTWRAWNALLLLKLGGAASQSALPEEDIYRLADEYLFLHQHTFLANADTAKEIIPVMLYQTRAAIRVRDAARRGIQPMVEKKWSQKKIKHAEAAYAKVLIAMFTNRSGLGNHQDAASIL